MSQVEEILKSSDNEAIRSELWQNIIDSIDDKNLLPAIEKIGELFSDKTAVNDAAGAIDTIPEIAELDEKGKTKVMQVAGLFIHMGQLSDTIASHNAGNTHKIINETVEKLADSGLSTQEVAQQLGEPEIHNVYTAHPTYVQTLENTKLQRQYDIAAQEADIDGMNTSMKAMVEDNAVIEDKLTALGETDFMVYYLKNTYQTTHRIYAEADEALEAHAEKTGDSYDPKELVLGLRQSSWGSGGDKDGNTNILSQTTAESVTKHREGIASMYKRDITHLAEALGDTAEVEEKLTGLLKKVEGLDPYKNNSDLISEVTSEMQETLFDLYDQTKDSSPDTAKTALAFARSVRHHGMHLGEIEYRETAEESEKVLRDVIPLDAVREILDQPNSPERYNDLKDSDKHKVLNAIMEDPEKYKLSEWKDEALGIIDSLQDAERKEITEATGYEHPKSITFHTLKRLELAKANPDMFKGQVLAESASALHVKEMQTLLKATGNEKNVRIIPLFEDPAILKDIRGTLTDMYSDKAYLSNMVNNSLQDLEKRKPDVFSKLSSDTIGALKSLDLSDASTRKETVASVNKMISKDTDGSMSMSDLVKGQIQIAHSDNCRRGGFVGAKAAIYKAEKAAKEVSAEFGMEMQLYQGGSLTDSFRGGVRMIGSQANLYGTWGHVKNTIQGMDLAQLNNAPAALQSFLSELTCHCAEKMHLNKKSLNVEREIKRNIFEDDKVIDLMEKQTDYYKDSYFGSATAGFAIAQVFDYAGNKESGTKASRAGKRGKSEGLPEDTYVDIVKGTRTIGFSETYQHGSYNPIITGSGNLYNDLKDYFKETKASEGTGFADLLRKGQISDNAAENIKSLYDHAPVMKQTMDHLSYAVATTDFDEVWRNAMQNEKGEQKTLVSYKFDDEGKAIESSKKEEVIENRPRKYEQLEALAQEKESSIVGMISWQELEFRKAAKVTHAALTGKELDVENLSSKEIQTTMRSLLPRYENIFNNQDAASSIAKSCEGEKDGMMKTMLHALKDLAYLVRPPSKAETMHFRQAPEHAQTTFKVGKGEIVKKILNGQEGGIEEGVPQKGR